jgi:hypothetical protein
MKLIDGRGYRDDFCFDSGKRDWKLDLKIEGVTKKEMHYILKMVGKRVVMLTELGEDK